MHILALLLHAITLELEMLPLIDEVFDQALRLRVSDSLKTPDALHLGAAIVHGCSEFWTNDDRLSRVSRRMAINIFSAVNSTDSGEVGRGDDSAKPTLCDR